MVQLAIRGTVAEPSSGLGVLFSISKAGIEKNVYSFGGGTTGKAPWADLIEFHGTIYGTTSGFDTDKGTVFGISP